MVEDFLRIYKEKRKNWFVRQLICNAVIAAVFVFAVIKTNGTDYFGLACLVGALSFLTSAVSNFKTEFGSLQGYQKVSHLYSSYVRAKKAYDKAVEQGADTVAAEVLLDRAEQAIIDYLNES